MTKSTFLHAQVNRGERLNLKLTFKVVPALKRAVVILRHTVRQKKAGQHAGVAAVGFPFSAESQLAFDLQNYRQR